MTEIVALVLLVVIPVALTIHAFRHGAPRKDRR
jgi:hypothetical protein